MVFQYWVTMAEKAAKKAERKAKRETTDDVVSKIYAEAINALNNQRKTLMARKAAWDPTDAENSFDEVEAEVTRFKRIMVHHKNAIATLMDKADDLVKEHYPQAASGSNGIAKKSQSLESATTGKFVILQLIVKMADSHIFCSNFSSKRRRL